MDGPASLTVTPIGVARTAYETKVAAPRQAPLAAVPGRIELLPEAGLEHAIEDLTAWSFLWVLFWFHQAEGWRPKVQPPRSLRKRGVLATRSPHRPNPIGLSAVRLVRVEGLTLHVEGLDLVDGTPVLDIKPYVAYADRIDDAGDGWLENADPGSRYQVAFDPLAQEQLELLREHGVDLEPPLRQVLELGPAPHPYRRIKPLGSRSQIAWQDWRAVFSSQQSSITIHALFTGHKPRRVAEDDSPGLRAHRALVDRFGWPGHRL